MPDAIRLLNEALSGRYRIERELGKGGMGEVYLARDERLGRRVAIKRIRAESKGDVTYRARFLREARSAARLSHPAVVQIFDIIEGANDEMIVMEFVEGRTLAEVLHEGALDVRRIVDVLLQVTDGLQAAHEAGLVHRDLKGENIVVTPEGDAKILDFGIAAFADDGEDTPAITKEGMPLGTFRAMSPEQCDGTGVDARSDLYSLGVLLYEAFAGYSPFLARTRLGTLSRVLTHHPPTPNQVNASIPESLSELTMALLAKDPDDRPGTAAEVGAILGAVRDSDELAGVVVPRLMTGSTESESSTPQADSGAESGAELRRRTRDRARSRHSAPTTPLGPGRSAVRRSAVAALAIVAVVFAVWMTAGPEASSDRIMVFPLVGGTDVASSVGEDIATVIGHALDGVEPLSWLDGWSRLDAETRRDVRGLELDHAADLARAEAAAFFVTGRVVRSADGVQVFLDLRDSRSGDRVAGTDAASSDEEPWRAGLSAMSALLPTLIPTEVPDFGADFTGAVPEAVALFLQGEAAHRRARVGESLELFQSAFASDSTFWVAGIRAAQAASWEHDQATAGDLLERVLQLPMPPETESFARGVLAYVRFDPEEAVSELEAALAIDSTMTVAWAALGEVYRHRAPRESWTEAETPFAKALAQDSLAGYVLFHRLEELIRAGDLPAADDLRERFRAGEPDAHLMRQIDVMYDCVVDGPLARDWTADVRVRGLTVGFAAAQLLTGGRHLPCAEALYRAVLVADTTESEAEGRYWSGLLGLTGAKIAQGDFASARRLIVAASEGFETYQSLIDRSEVTEQGVRLPLQDVPWVEREVPLRGIHTGSLTRWSELAILVAEVHPELQDLGELGAADIRAIGDWSEIRYGTSVFLLGLWEARQGRFSEAMSASARLREIAADVDVVIGAYTSRMADALDAHRLIAEGDQAAGLERLRAITSNALEGTVFVELIGSFALERWVLAGLEEEQGDLARALSLVRGFDAPSSVTNAIYLPVALRACDRLASAQGRATVAAECRARSSELEGR